MFKLHYIWLTGVIAFKNEVHVSELIIRNQMFDTKGSVLKVRFWVCDSISELWGNRIHPEGRNKDNPFCEYCILESMNTFVTHYNTLIRHYKLANKYL